VSVNVAISPFNEKSKLAVVCGTYFVMLINVVCVERFDPASLVAVSFMEKFPPPNICTGFCNVLNTISVLLPVTFLNVQLHPVSGCSRVYPEVSVKYTVVGDSPRIGDA
jgi:hypothetical protein